LVARLQFKQGNRKLEALGKTRGKTLLWKYVKISMFSRMFPVYQTQGTLSRKQIVLPGITQELRKLPGITQELGKLPGITQELGKFPGITQEASRNHSGSKHFSKQNWEIYWERCTRSNVSSDVFASTDEETMRYSGSYDNHTYHTYHIACDHKITEL
jgi:hypothetical protein